MLDISDFRLDTSINKATKQQLDISTALANITTKSITTLFFGLAGTLSCLLPVLLKRQLSSKCSLCPH
jgi:hypothetical protein